MKIKSNLLLLAVMVAIALPLFFAGAAGARYLGDGGVPDGNGGWKQPTDFVCIVGLHADGTLDIADNVTNSRDCIYLQTGTMNGGTAFNLSTITTQDACTLAGFTSVAQCTAAGKPASCCTGAGTGTCAAANFNPDGAKHQWATSFCSKSLKGLDRTQQMCQGIGGTWVTTGKCVAYVRQFKGQDATTGAPLTFGTKGTSTADAGFCYATMDMSLGYSVSTCPSNLATTSPYNANGAYDWSSNGNQCRYAKGIAGNLASALTKYDGTTYPAGSYLDLSAFTTMGDCLKNGGSWNNWVGQPLSVNTVWTSGSNVGKVPVWNYTTQAPDADNGCIHCHSSTVEYNGPAEREKDSYLQTGHKNMLRKVTAGTKWAGPDHVVYTNDTLGNAIDFTNATVGGGALYFIFGDWMVTAPNAVGPNGDTPTYSCGACHTTGFNDSTNPGVQSIGTPGYVAAQPQVPYSNAVTAGHKWDLEGINCSRCHNAAVGPVTLGQIAGGSCSSDSELNITPALCATAGGTWTSVGSPSAFPSTHATSGGMGTLASGTGRTNLCFGCHQSIAKNWTTNGVNVPAGLTQYDPTLIPTGINHGASPGRDFNGHTLGNEFLNSPHALYAGTNSNTANGGVRLNSLGKFDLVDPVGTTEYGSLFKGYTCWQSPTSNSPAKTKFDGTEIKIKSECESLYGVGSWRADTGDSTSARQKQGTCTTCHDVHNSLFVADQVEKATRKKCEDCHVNNSTTGATDSAAPQVDESFINHLKTANTPFDNTKYEDPCAVCHMAVQAVRNGSLSFSSHLWRINPDPAYNTFPTPAQFNGAGVAQDRNAQTSPDGTYTKAVWTDLDLACGQCHGGDSGTALPGVPPLNKAQLAPIAQGMHDSFAVNYTVTFTTSVSGATVNTLASVDCGGTTCPAGLTYNWTWGDGNTDQTLTANASHTYTSPGTKSITLIVGGALGQNFGTYKRNVMVTLVIPPPAAAGTCVWHPDTWTMDFTDTTTGGAAPVQVVVDWGDSSTRTITTQLASTNHVYNRIGTFTVTQRSTDSKLQTSTATCTGGTATPSYLTISGTVKNKLGTSNLALANVQLKSGNIVLKTMITAANGSFTTGATLKPGTYTLNVTKSGYTFAPTTITAGSGSTGITINATAP